MIPLFERYPALKEKLPYVSLGEFPTPVARLERLGAELGHDALYFKQDGLSGATYGGNKIRKLEFLFGEALRKKAKNVMTFGFAGSNHALATAVYAQKLGVKSISVLMAQIKARYVRRNLLMGYACGAELHHFENEAGAYVFASAKLIRGKLSRGGSAHIIAPGGSSPLGTIGYVNAGLELREQVDRGSVPEPDLIFVPLGTMGTAAGLTIGLKAAGLKTRVVSVRVADAKYGNTKKFVELAAKTVSLLHRTDPSFPRIEISGEDVDMRGEFFGGQYALFTEQGMAAVDLLARTEGLTLDGSYTGKTMAALIDHVKSNERSAAKEVILFWDTYNARDFSDAIKGIDYHDLPRPFHRYFEENVQPLDRA